MASKTEIEKDFRYFLKTPSEPYKQNYFAEETEPELEENLQMTSPTWRSEYGDISQPVYDYKNLFSTSEQFAWDDPDGIQPSANSMEPSSPGAGNAISYSDTTETVQFFPPITQRVSEEELAAETATKYLVPAEDPFCVSKEITLYADIYRKEANKCYVNLSAQDDNGREYLKGYGIINSYPNNYSANVGDNINLYFNDPNLPKDRIKPVIPIGAYPIEIKWCPKFNNWLPCIDLSQSKYKFLQRKVYLCGYRGNVPRFEDGFIFSSLSQNMLFEEFRLFTPVYYKEAVKQLLPEILENAKKEIEDAINASIYTPQYLDAKASLYAFKNFWDWCKQNGLAILGAIKEAGWKLPMEDVLPLNREYYHWGGGWNRSITTYILVLDDDIEFAEKSSNRFLTKSGEIKIKIGTATPASLNSTQTSQIINYVVPGTLIAVRPYSAANNDYHLFRWGWDSSFSTEWGWIEMKKGERHFYQAEIDHAGAVFRGTKLLEGDMNADKSESGDIWIDSSVPPCPGWSGSGGGSFSENIFIFPIWEDQGYSKRYKYFYPGGFSWRNNVINSNNPGVINVGSTDGQKTDSAKDGMDGGTMLTWQIQNERMASLEFLQSFHNSESGLFIGNKILALLLRDQKAYNDFMKLSSDFLRPNGSFVGSDESEYLSRYILGTGTPVRQIANYWDNGPGMTDQIGQTRALLLNYSKFRDNLESVLFHIFNEIDKLESRIKEAVDNQLDLIANQSQPSEIVKTVESLKELKEKGNIGGFVQNNSFGNKSYWIDFEENSFWFKYCKLICHYGLKDNKLVVRDFTNGELEISA